MEVEEPAVVVQEVQVEVEPEQPVVADGQEEVPPVAAADQEAVAPEQPPADQQPAAAENAEAQQPAAADAGAEPAAADAEAAEPAADAEQPAAAAEEPNPDAEQPAEAMDVDQKEPEPEPEKEPSYEFLFGVEVILKELVNQKRFNEEKGRIVKHTCDPNNFRKVAVRLPDTPIRVIVDDMQFKPSVEHFRHSDLESLFKQWGEEKESSQEWAWDGKLQEEWAMKFIEEYMAFHDKSKDLENVARMFDIYFLDVEKSQSLFLESIEKDDKNLSAMNLLAILFKTKLKDNEKAKSWYEKILEIEPENFQTLLDLAALLEVMELWEDVVTTYDRALKVQPESIELTQNYVAFLTKKLPNPEKVKELYQAILSHHPTDVELIGEYGKFEEEREQYEVARNYYIRALYMPGDEGKDVVLARLKDLCTKIFPDSPIPEVYRRTLDDQRARGVLRPGDGFQPGPGLHHPGPGLHQPPGPGQGLFGGPPQGHLPHQNAGLNAGLFGVPQPVPDLGPGDDHQFLGQHLEEEEEEEEDDMDF